MKCSEKSSKQNSLENMVLGTFCLFIKILNNFSWEIHIWLELMHYLTEPSAAFVVGIFCSIEETIFVFGFWWTLSAAELMPWQ